MEIRFAKLRDVPGIITLLRQVGRVHHEGRPDIFREDCQKYSPSQVIAMLEVPDSPILVAAEGAQILGYCFCQIHRYAQDPVMADRSTLYIDDLCVEETCRGKVIGKALYEAACAHGREQSCGSITLNVWACNENAVKFYEKLGLKMQKIGMETLLEEN